MFVRPSTSTFAALLLGAALVLPGCAGQTSPRSIHYNVDPSADFSQYQTFSVGYADAENPFPQIGQRLETAIASQLTAKGYTPAATDDGADLVIRYAISLNRDERVVAEQIPVGQGVYNRYTMQQVNEGGVLLNAIDPKAGRAVWKASSVRDVTGMKAEDFTQARADEAMSEVFGSFPSRQ